MTCSASRYRIWQVILFIVMVLCPWAWVKAHDGPPFPLFVDQRIKNGMVSAWADPDVGVATFYIVVIPLQRIADGETLDVSMRVQPVSGRLPCASYKAKPQILRNRRQYEVKASLDRCDIWNIRFLIHGSDGHSAVLSTKVTSTLPGTGPWDLAIYGFPFALIGALWIVGILRVRRLPNNRGNTQSTVTVL